MVVDLPHLTTPLQLLDDLLASLSSASSSSSSSSSLLSSYAKIQSVVDSDDGTPRPVDTNNTECSNDDSLTTTNDVRSKQDVVLRASDFLFPTIIDNALSLLDEQARYEEETFAQQQQQQQQQTESSLAFDNYCQPTTKTEAMMMIRRIRAASSGREVILVRKQSSSSSSIGSKIRTNPKKVVTGNNSADNNNNKSFNDFNEYDKCIMDEYYLCLLGKKNKVTGTTIPSSQHKRKKRQHHLLLQNAETSTSSSHSSSTSYYRLNKCQKQQQQQFQLQDSSSTTTPPPHYCSCRSYFQNMKGMNDKDTSMEERGGGECEGVVCKHLLAILLMPHLPPWSNVVGGGMKVETVNDKVFARLVSYASIG